VDCIISYNQVQVALEDQEVMTFRMLKDTFFYKMRPFWLKNVEATYERAMQTILEDILCKTVDCYVEWFGD